MLTGTLSIFMISDVHAKGFQMPSYYSHLSLLPCVSKAMYPLPQQPNCQQCSYVVMCCQHNHHDTMRTALTELNSQTNIRKNTAQTGLFISLFKSFIKNPHHFLAYQRSPSNFQLPLNFQAQPSTDESTRSFCHRN